MKNYCFNSIYNTNRQIEIHRCSESVTYEHTHDFWEFSLVLNGQIVNFINDKRILLPQRSLLFIRPEYVHRMEQLDNTNKAEILNVSVTDELMKKIFDFYGIDINDFFIGGEYGIVCNLSSTQNELLLDLILEYEKKSCLNEETLSIYEKMMLSEILKLFFMKKYSLSNKKPEWLVNVLVAMNEHTNFSQKMEFFYEISGYSKTQCIRLFSELMETTPIKYFVKCKILYSCKLIDTTNCNLLQIAEDCGFYSLSHFNKCFATIIGMNPSKYKNFNNKV